MRKHAIATIRWISLVLWLAWSGLAGSAASAAASPPALALQPGAAILLHSERQLLLPRGQLSAARVAADAIDAQLAPGDGRLVQLGPDNELWLRVRLHNPARRPAAWQLVFGLPAIDEVTLFEQRGGTWTEQSAGDRVAQGSWPREGRFPRFGLDFEAGETRELILRVRNGFAVPLALWVHTDAASEAADQRGYLGYGIALGALFLVVIACLVQAVLYRNAAYAWYGAYVLLLALAAFTGLANQFVWGQFPLWGDASKGVLTLASAGASVLFVRTLCSVQTRDRALSLASGAVGAIVLLIAAGLAIMTVIIPWLYGLGMLLAAVTVLLTATFTWRRGDAVGAWVLGAHVPLIAVSALIVLRMFGMAPFSFDANLLAALAIALILPLLLTALHLRSRELLSVQVRERELASTDPLTGLLAPHLFRDRILAAVSRFRKSRHNAVVLYIRLANHPRIREVHGSTIAEQSMIRAAIKLRRLMPDADCMGRVGEATVGLIFESITSREAVMQRAARLVAHGLMPLMGLKPEVTLQFHVAANVLSENLLDATELMAALDQALASMSPRTRRPIRFLEPGALGELGADPESDGDEVGTGAVAG